MTHCSNASSKVSPHACSLQGHRVIHYTVTTKSHCAMQVRNMNARTNAKEVTTRKACLNFCYGEITGFSSYGIWEEFLRRKRKILILPDDRKVLCNAVNGYP